MLLCTDLMGLRESPYEAAPQRQCVCAPGECLIEIPPADVAHYRIYSSIPDDRHANIFRTERAGPSREGDFVHVRHIFAPVLIGWNLPYCAVCEALTLEAIRVCSIRGLHVL
jgi:hypothetical protein